MRPFALFLCLLLLISLLPLAHADWGEFVTVRVLDAKMRPLPGASVNITWQITKGHIGTTATKLTNANGRVNFSIDNYEHLDSVLDPYFTVYVRYGSLNPTTRFLNNAGETPRTFILPVYKITFMTTDNSGQPISVNIDVDGLYKTKTDRTGTALLALPAGRHSVNVIFRNSKQNSSLTVSDDAVIPLKLRLYQLDVQVLDDLGAPLDAQVYAGTDVLNTAADGYVHFSNVTDSRLLLTVHYGQYKKELAVDLGSLNHTAVIFDLHKPSVSNLQSVFNGSTLQVRANVADEGDYASGLSQGTSSVQLIYSFGSSPGTQTVPMYAAGYNLFEAYIKLPEDTREVHYTVQASDAEGNLASSSDVFVAAVQKPVTPTEPATPPSTASKSWVEENAWVIAIFVILIAGAVAYWYYLSRKPPSSAAGNAMYTYGKKEAMQNQSKPFSMPIKKTEQAQASSDDSLALPKPQAPPQPPSASGSPPSASGRAPPSASASGPAQSDPQVSSPLPAPSSSSSSPAPKSSKPSWAPPWAKLPGMSNKPDNAPPWAGRFGGTKTPSAQPAASSSPASPSMAPSAPAPPSIPSAPSYPPAGPSMAPMPPPPSMSPMSPSSPSVSPHSDSSNPAFGSLPGGKAKPPEP